MDIDLRQWNILCRQGVNSFLPILKNLDFVLSLVIQGDTNDELPEQILGAARINFLDITKARII